MSALFVRVSVFFEGRQLDVSLPAHRPTVDITDDIVGLLSQHFDQTDTPNLELSVPEAHTWVLSSPTLGIIEPYSSLSDRGVSDGERLYLTSRHEAAHSPFVDDAISEVRTTIGNNQWRWTSEIRSAGILATVAATAVIFLLCLGISLFTLERSVNAQIIVHCCAIAVTTVILVGLAVWKPHPWMRWLGVSLPAGALVASVFFTADLPAEVGLPSTLSAVALTGAIAAYVAGRGKPVGAVASVTALIIVGVAGGLAAVACALGVDFLAMSAWTAWVPVLMLIVAPTVAINSTGLATLLRVNDAGEQVERGAIRVKALRSEAVSRGIVWGATALSGAVILTLAASPFWQHGVIAALLCPILLLRANGFADVRIISALLTTGVLGIAVLAGSFVAWGQRGWSAESGRIWLFADSSATTWPWVAAGAVILLAAIILITIHNKEPDELEEARLVRVFSTLDVLACLTIIPLILAAQGVFTYYWATT